MNSVITEKFRDLYSGAPAQTQRKIRDAHALWMENPHHPSLRFKKVHERMPVYSVRVDLDWRAVGMLRADTMVWFWVGPHDEYDKLLGKL